MKKIRKGDLVILTAGRDKGRKGTVIEVFADDRVRVEGLNMAKKHQRPKPNAGIQGARGRPQGAHFQVEQRNGRREVARVIWQQDCKKYIATRSCRSSRRIWRSRTRCRSRKSSRSP